MSAVQGSQTERMRAEVKRRQRQKTVKDRQAARQTKFSGSTTHGRNGTTESQ